MKKSIYLIVLLFSGFFITAQEYQYKIKVKDVNTLAEAKLVTNPLRENFYTYPLFDENSKQFVFNAKQLVNEDRVEAMLEMIGYELLYFKRTELEISTSNEKQNAAK